MTDNEFIDVCRKAQRAGNSQIRATLFQTIHGVKHIALRNLDGSYNGNPHDVWIESVSGITVLGRAYLGSRKMDIDLEGWPGLINIITSTH